jgi:hypothetical protein
MRSNTGVPPVGGMFCLSRRQAQKNLFKGKSTMNATTIQPEAVTEKAHCLHSWIKKLYDGKVKCMHCGRIDTLENFENEKILIIASL